MRRKFEPVVTGVKTCCNPACGKTKPVTEFGVDRTKSDGRKGRCLECVNKAQRKPGSTKQYRVAATNAAGLMNCTNPNHIGAVWLDPERFTKDSSKKRGRRPHCKDCVRRRMGYEKERIPAEVRPDKLAKACSRCETMLGLHEFVVNPRGVLGRDSACKACLMGLERAEYEAKVLVEFLWDMGQEFAGERGEKVCNKCFRSRAQDEFNKCRTSLFGLAPACRDCSSAKSPERKAWDRKQAAAFERGEHWCYDCKLCLPLDAYYNSNKNRFGVMHICKDCHAKREKEKRKNNVLYDLICRLRTNLRCHLLLSGWTKTSRTYEYLQCSYEFFMQHINSGEYVYGDSELELELDHIVPVSVAETEFEIKALFHWSNWRLVLKEVNRAKSDIIPHRNLLNSNMTPEILAIYEREAKNADKFWTE